MAESPRRVDLRLTIPVAAPYPEIARDLASKFVEYVGAPDAARATVAAAIAAAVAAADGQPSVDLLLSADGPAITVSVTAPD